MNDQSQVTAVPNASKRLHRSEFCCLIFIRQPRAAIAYIRSSKFFSERREEDGELAESLCTSNSTPNAPVQRKPIGKNFGQEPRRFRVQINVSRL